MKIPRKFYWILSVLNLLAMAATAYLIYLHFVPDASTLCNVSETLNCDIVNKSPYADIFGIPVSILGFITYLGLFAFSVRGLFRDQSKWIPHIFALVSLGLLFTLRLTYIEAFVLYAWCIFCVAQQILILIEWSVLLHLHRLIKKS